jgi:hypothetical protein
MQFFNKQLLLNRASAGLASKVLFERLSKDKQKKWRRSLNFIETALSIETRIAFLSSCESE